MAEPSNLKILVIMANPSDIGGLNRQLMHEKFIPTYTVNLPLALQELQSSSFDVILVSWNLRLIDVQKTYEFLDARLSSVVAVFSEVDSPVIHKELIDSRIEKTVFPPITAGLLITRIKQMLRQRAKELQDVEYQKEKEKKKQEMEVTSVRGEDVPDDIEWESETPQEGGDRLWQGVSSRDESATYIFQGEEAPKWNGKTWVAKGDVYMKVAKQARGFMGMVLKQPIKKESKLTVLGRERQTKKYVLPTTHKEDGSSAFYLAVASSLGDKGKFGDPAENSAEINQLVVSWVNAKPMRGLVLLADADKGEFGLDLLYSVQSAIQTLAQENHVKAELLLDNVTLDIPPVSAAKWLSRQTRYHYCIQSSDGKRLMIAYIPVDVEMHFGVDESGERYSIPVKDTLRAGARVPVDFFIFMKKNQRYIKYIAKDTVVSEPMVSKLTRGDIQELLINREDFLEFLLYKARYYLGLTR